MTTNPAAEAPHLVTRILHLPITSDAEAFHTSAWATERVMVALTTPDGEQQGRLEAFIVSATESELERLDAAPAGWRQGDTLEKKLSDQLYRIRLLGKGGLALRFAGLAGIADGDGQLGAEDSHTLRKLFAIAECEPLQLYLPEPAAALRVIGAPQQLSQWLTASSKTGRVASIEYEAHDPLLLDTASAALERLQSMDLSPPALEAFVSSGLAPSTRVEEDGVREPTAQAKAREELRPEHADARPSEAPELPPLEDEKPNQRCAAWSAQLQNMSGPKVHGSVERAFLTAYLPLRREVAAGKAPADARIALTQWAEGFAQSYASAFKNLGTHARRPKMVKDVVELGFRWLGQHRARQCQLLLVSGMRFDLGQRLNEEIERRLVGRAVCADQALLWAALPSNSGAQQIGDTAAVRGPRTGSGSAGHPPSPTPSLPTPSVPGIQGLRVGNRELFKLDQLGGDLSQAGEAEPARLGRLASSLAECVVPWMQEQPPETLVVVFGDHGFHWQATEQGTSPAQRGGALPEQVLVPASAWIMGDFRQKARDPRVAPGLH